MTNRVVKEILKLAKEVYSAKSYELKRDVKTKKGEEFKRGTKLKIVSYDRKWPYVIRLECPLGKRFAVTPEGAHKYLKRFPKPPSISQMERWMDSGVAKAVDGSRVEPDGFSPAGAPSWMLVVGVI